MPSAALAIQTDEPLRSPHMSSAVVAADSVTEETGLTTDAWTREQCALFLDIDGTLAPFAETPDEATIPNAALVCLARLQIQLNGAVALISGRSMRDIDRLGAPHVFPAAALHGLEIRLPDGTVESPHDGAELFDPARVFFADLSARHPELLIEDKGFSLAVHYRRCPDLEPAVLDALRIFQTQHAARMFLQEGKLVGELRLRGGDKGTAIERILALPPFQRRRPVFAGDDKTDEDAFRAVNARGGLTIKIGEGESEAQARLSSPARLHEWLFSLSARFESAAESTSPHSALSFPPTI